MQVITYKKPTPHAGCKPPPLCPLCLQRVVVVGGSTLKLRLRMGATETQLTSPIPNIQGWEGQEKGGHEGTPSPAVVSAWEILWVKAVKEWTGAPTLHLAVIPANPAFSEVAPASSGLDTEMQAFKQTNMCTHTCRHTCKLF